MSAKDSKSRAPTNNGTANGTAHGGAGDVSGAGVASVVHYVRELVQSDTTGYALAAPRGVDVDTKTRTAFVADSANNRVCRVELKPKHPSGLPRMTVLAGRADMSGHKDAAAGTDALFAKPSGVAFDGTDLFVCDTDNHRIRKIALSSGAVSTFVGAGPTGAGAGSFEDGDVASAKFNAPSDVYAHRGTKGLYIADTQNHRIRVVRDGKVSTLAGCAMGAKDAHGLDACFRAPTGVAVDGAGNVFVADRGNNCIRRITPDGQVTTYAGALPHTDDASSNEGMRDGSASEAQFRGPERVCVDHSTGDVYVSDTGNHRIRKIHRDKETGALTVSTVAGSGVGPSGAAECLDGEVLSAKLNAPVGLFAGEGLHDDSSIVFADSSNRLRLIDTTAPKPRADCRMCDTGDCTLM